jgi:hypothetical protein
LIGSGGTGKSTFARKLGEAPGLPVVHLDPCYWHPRWDPTLKLEWTGTIDEIAARAEWIVDGNYGGTLDLPRVLCHSSDGSRPTRTRTALTSSADSTRFSRRRASSSRSRRERLRGFFVTPTVPA